MAQPTIRQILTDDGPNTASTVTTSAACKAGDVVVVLVSNDWGMASQVGTPTATGITFTQRIAGDTNETNRIHTKVFTGVLSTDGAKTITCPVPSAADNAIIVVVLDGSTLHTTWLDGVSGNIATANAASQSQPVPTITTTGGADTLLIGFVSCGNSGTHTSSAMTVRAAQKSNSDGNGPYITSTVLTKALTASGATGSQAVAYSGPSKVWLSHAIGIRGKATVASTIFPSFTDAFPGTTLDPAKWTAINGGGVDANRMYVNAHNNAGAPVYSSVRSSLEAANNKTWIFHVANLPQGNVNAQMWIMDDTPANGVDRLGFEYVGIDDRMEFLGQTTGYAPIGTSVSVTNWSTLGHSWFKLEHTGTNLIWSTSPDGWTWTVRRTMASPPAWMATADCRASYEAFRNAAGVNDTLLIDNVNLPPTSPPTNNLAGASSLEATAAISVATPSLRGFLNETFDNVPAVLDAVNPVVRRVASVGTLPATAELSATARQGLGMLVALAGGPATISATPFVHVRGVSATLPATAAFLSRPALVGAAPMSATAVATFIAFVSRPFSVQLSSSAAMSADAYTLPALNVVMFSSGNMSLDEYQTLLATPLPLSATADATFNGYKQTWGQSSLPATASLAANAVLRQAAAISLSATASLAVAQPRVNHRLTVSMASEGVGFFSLGPTTYELQKWFLATSDMSVGLPTRDMAASVNLNAPASVMNPDVIFVDTLMASTSSMDVDAALQNHYLNVVMGITARLVASAQRVQVIDEPVIDQSDSLQSYLFAEARISVPGGVTLNATARLSVDPYVHTPIFVEPKGPRIRQEWLPTMRLFVFDTITGRVGWELPYSSLSWNSKLNTHGSMSATLVVEAVLQEMYAQGAADPIKAFREFLTGPYRFSLAVTYGHRVVFAGPYLPSSDPSDSPTVDIQGVEIDKIFESRILINPGSGSVSDASRDVTFKAAAKRGHIFRIVEHATSGLGRKLPIICSDPPLLRGEEVVTYKSYDLTTAAKAIEEIVTSDDGPDVRFDPFLIRGQDGLYVNWDLQIGDPYLDYSQIWTWDDEDIALSRDTDAVSLATWVYAPGSGQDRGKLIGQSHSDYLTMLGFPVLEKVQGDNTSETMLRELDSFAGAAVRAGQEPTQKWSAKIPRDHLQSLGMYKPGDPTDISVNSHPTIEHGLYRRRITEMSGDNSDLVSLTIENDVTQKSEELPIIIGAAEPPMMGTRWAGGIILDGFLDKPQNFNSTVPTINLESSWYRGNSIRIDMPGDGAQNPGIGASPRTGDQRIILEPITPGRQGNTGSFTEGDKGTFGVSFVLEPGFPINTNSWIVLAQLKDDAPYNYSAPFELRVGNGVLGIGGWDGRFYREIIPIETGERYDVAIEIYFSAYVNRNYYSVWVNGIQHVFNERTGPNTATLYNGYKSYFQVGLYRDIAIIEPASLEYGAIAFDKDPRAVLAYLSET